MARLAKIEGEVVVKENNMHSIEFYEAEFVLADDVETEGQARTVIRKGLITEYLRKKVKNFKRVRTCQVVEFSKTDETPKMDDLELLLLAATKLGCVPENIDNYKRRDYKVKALEKAIANEKSRREKQKPDPMADKGYVD